jgi:hypothetical protein
MTDAFERLAGLVQVKNSADAAIAELIRRPSAPGNIGEFVAAAVFAIELMTSGSHPGHDGMFTTGSLAGRRSTSRRTAVMSPSWTSAPIRAITTSS